MSLSNSSSTLLLSMSLSDSSLSTFLLSIFLLFFSLSSLFFSVLVMNSSCRCCRQCRSWILLVDAVVKLDNGFFLSMLSSMLIMHSSCRCCRQCWSCILLVDVVLIWSWLLVADVVDELLVLYLCCCCILLRIVAVNLLYGLDEIDLCRCAFRCMCCTWPLSMGLLYLASIDVLLSWTSCCSLCTCCPKVGCWAWPCWPASIDKSVVASCCCLLLMSSWWTRCCHRPSSQSLLCWWCCHSESSCQSAMLMMSSLPSLLVTQAQTVDHEGCARHQTFLKFTVADELFAEFVVDELC